MSSSSFAIQLLSKIGTPLAAAVEAGPAKGDDATSAEHMAKMLGLAVEMSIALHEKLDVTEDEKQADETRTALAAVSAELIAGFYSANQKLPEENDKARIVKSLESVLGFADKFSSSKDQASRLTTLGSKQVLFDETQSQLVALQAIGNIVNAVIEFPFGQSENKLIQDIADRLQKDAFNIAKENGTSDKLSELMIFKSLAALYAECHRAETKKISGGDQSAAPSLDPVWKAYETRVAMMEALVSGDESTPAESAGPSPVAQVAQTEAPPAQAPVTPAAEAPPSAPAQAPAAPAGGGGPMGFFAKKPAGDAAPPPAAPAEPPPSAPVEPPPAETPPATPPLTPPPPPPPVAPTAPPAEEKPAGEAGNPMSFFKGPPKTEGEE